jgi:endonuclease YncB( thermonuclease family)
MSGRARLPSGEPRKASQRHSRRPAQPPHVVELTWRPGDTVHWRGYTGSYLRDADDGHAEVLIGTRTYRVHRGDLRSA